MASEAAPLTTAGPGAVLAGRYEVVRELGRGGMGVVYLCRDASSGRRVALKSLFRGDAKVDADDIWWFQQEARALAALDHPAIVRARDFDLLADGSPYLVMDVAAGRSLLSWLELAAIPWPWPFTVLWSFVNQILSGLAHAHARGVIHGDLKPTNLMIDFPARSKLPKVAILDLGLASLVRDPIDHRLDGSERSSRVVRVGAGTPGWMAPEQIRRATPHYGPSTDLYALGSIVYHLLAGREPFTGSVDEVLDGHRNKTVPDFVVPANVPPEIKPFVQTLLQKRPWHRFDFAADAIRAWNRLRPQPATEAWTFRVSPDDLGGPSSSNREPMIAAVAADPPAVAPTATGEQAPGLLSLRQSPMVARLEERTELNALVEQVCQVNGPRQSLALLYGEAGVGKSRLAEWLCEQVHEQGTMVPLRVRYRPIPAPLDGIVGAVNAHFGLERADRNVVERTLLNCWDVAPDDEQGLVWVAATAEWLRPTPSGKTVPLGPTGKRFFFDTPEVRRKVIFRTLTKIGEKRPILLWLDDLHLASSRTLEILTKMREEVPNLRVLLLATVRAEAIAIDPEAMARLDTLKATYGGRVTYLPALTEAETAELILSSLQLEEAAVQEAATRSKGNPLFALQLLHAWAATNRLELTDGHYHVPASVLEVEPQTTAELWDERLSAVPEDLRLAAVVASSLGGDIPLPVLRALLDSLSIPSAPAIHELTRAHILISAGPDRLRWPHALLLEHLLSRLVDHADAKKIFAFAAQALTLHPAAGTRRIVSHRITNLLRAGDRAGAVDRVLEFVESHWARGRDATATLDDLARLDGLIVPGRGRAAYSRWRAEALHQLGRLSEARSLSEAARTEFAELGDERGQAESARLLGHIMSEQNIGEGRELVAKALEKLEAIGDTLGRAECERVLGEIEYRLGDHKAAHGRLSRASKRFERADDSIGHGECLLVIGQIDLCAGRFKRGEATLRQARREFEKGGYRLGLARCEVAQGHLAHRLDDLPEARARAAAARDKMRELGDPMGEGRCERLLGMVAFDDGRWDDARAHTLACSALYERASNAWGKCESALLLAQIALATNKSIGKDLILACQAVGLTESEPRQHLALSLAWLAYVERRAGEALPHVVAARTAFASSKITGDHTQHLLTRLAALDWPSSVGDAIRGWHSELLA